MGRRVIEPIRRPYTSSSDVGSEPDSRGDVTQSVGHGLSELY